MKTDSRQALECARCALNQIVQSNVLASQTYLLGEAEAALKIVMEELKRIRA